MRGIGKRQCGVVPNWRSVALAHQGMPSQGNRYFSAHPLLLATHEKDTPTIPHSSSPSICTSQNTKLSELKAPFVSQAEINPFAGISAEVVSTWTKIIHELGDEMGDKFPVKMMKELLLNPSPESVSLVQRLQQGFTVSIIKSELKQTLSRTSDSNTTVAFMNIEEYATQFQHAFRFELRPMLTADKIVGLSNLASGIKGWVTKFDNALRTMILQRTGALVIKNSPGVGKTFGSVAVASVLNDQVITKDAEFYLPLYVGFNSSFPLSDTELLFLGRDDWLVGRIIARRALHQLWALFALCNSEGNCEKKLWDIVVQGTGGSRHLIPMPKQDDDHQFADHKAFPLNETSVIASLIIEELSKRCGSRRLVVLFIMDEGQVFDEAVGSALKEKSKSAAVGGARLALRYARRLQLECSKSTKALLLPIMTGINPATSFLDATDGTTDIYSGPLHTRKEFLDIAISLMAKGAKLRGIDLLATIMYPVARDLESFFSNTNKPYLKHAVDPDLAPLLLMASGTEKVIDAKYWQPEIPANFDADGTQFTPMPSFFRIDECLKHCHHIHMATGGEVLVACDLEVRSEIDVRIGMTVAPFESEVARMLRIILAATNTPLGSCGTEVNVLHEDMRKGWLAKIPWMDFQGATSFPRITTLPEHCSFIYPTAARPHQEPFALLNRHAAEEAAECIADLAARVAAMVQFDSQWQQINSHALHPVVCATLKAMQSKGECFALRCEGSAPVDFIFIVLTSDRGTDKRCTVELRLADAKHMTTSLPKRILDTDAINCMLPKFGSATKYLQVALSNECGMTVVGQRHAIITDCCVAEDAELLYGPHVTEATAAVTCVLSPETLKFPPFTNYLFSEFVTEE